jgi:hypothetical protein
VKIDNFFAELKRRDVKGGFYANPEPLPPSAFGVGRSEFDVCLVKNLLPQFPYTIVHCVSETPLNPKSCVRACSSATAGSPSST